MSDLGARNLAHRYFNALATRDPDSIGQFLDPAVDWLLIGPVELLSYCGHHLGKTAVIEVYRQMARELTTVSYVPEFLLADGDCASALTRLSVVQKQNGRAANLRVAHFARFSGPRVVEACTVMDSFSAVEQLLGHTLDPGLVAAERGPSPVQKIKA